MSKYEPLWNNIKDKKKDQFKLSFKSIKNILGFEIDHSFLNSKKELNKYGYEVAKISLIEKTIIIKKIDK